MNLVAVLIAPAVVLMSESDSASHVTRIAIALVAAAVAFGAIIASKRRAPALVDDEARAAA